MTVPFTDTQGQYLAYIATYTKLHRRPPAEADIQGYFGVTSPTFHRMIVILTEHGLAKVSRPVATRLNCTEDLLLEMRGVLDFHLKRIAAIQKQVDVLIERRRVRSPD